MAEDHPDIPDELGHEPIEVNARSVGMGMAALMGIMFASMLLVGGLTLLLAQVWGGQATVGVPPSATTLDDQRGSLRKLRETENSLLTEYAWIDAQAGIARIPINRAIEILAERMPQTQSATDENRPDNP